MTQLYSLVWDCLFPPFPSVIWKFVRKKGLLIVKWKPMKLAWSCHVANWLHQDPDDQDLIGLPHGDHQKLMICGWLQLRWRSDVFHLFFNTMLLFIMLPHLTKLCIYDKLCHIGTLCPILRFIVHVTFSFKRRFNILPMHYHLIIMHIYSKISLRKSWKGQNNTFKLRLIDWHY